MKKKFGIITAILICVALLLVFVACSGEGLKGVDDKKIEAKVAEIDAALNTWLYNNSSDTPTDLSSKLNSYLAENIGEFSLRDDKKQEIKATASAFYSAAAKADEPGTYTVKFTWTNGGTLTKTFTKQEVPADYAPWAGSYKDLTAYTAVSSSGKMGVINNIINAAFKEANKIVSDSVNGQFGVEGMVGVSTMGYNYGLEVKGNIDLLPREEVASDGEGEDAAETDGEVGAESEEEEDEVYYGEGPNETAFSILLKNGATGRVMGGIYYENAEEDENCKIYLQHLKDDEPQYKYIDYAILNKLFGMLELSFRPDKGAVLAEDKGLAGIFEKVGLDENTAGMVNSLVSKLVDAYQSADGKTYIMDINFGSLFAEVAKKFGSFTGVVKDALEGIPYLEDLDIQTMHGLLGHITIAATLDAAGNMTAFELSVNVPKCTFYFSADESENASKIDIPAFSFAIYAKDFAFGRELEIEEIIPDEVKEEAEYFSPTNVNLQGDLYLNTTINDKAVKSTYRYHLVTEVNPFKPSQAKASFTIKETAHAADDDSKAFNERKNTEFLKIVYEQSTQTIYTSGSVYGVEGVSKYTITDFDDFKETLFDWLGKNAENGAGLKWTEKETVPYIDIENKENLLPSAKAFLDNELAGYILNYYYNKKTGEYIPGFEPEEEEEVDETPAVEDTTDEDEGEDLTDDSDDLEADEEEEGGMMDMLKGYFDGGKAILDAIRELLDIDAEAKSLKVEITNEDIDEIAQQIAALIGTEWPTITDPSEVKVYVNTTDPAYKNAIYVKVVYGGDTYEVTLALTRDEEDAVATLSAKFLRTLGESGRTYDFSLVLDRAAETLAIDYVIKASATATKEEPGSFHTVNMNTTFNWGAKNVNNLELYSENEMTNAGDIFAGESQEKNVASVLVGGIMDLANNELVYPYAKMLGRFIVRQITAD